MNAFAKSLKRLRAADLAIRRNPLLYGSAREQIRALAESSLDQRREWTARKLHSVLAAAARTAYGRSVSGGVELRNWPLLDKTRLRDGPGAFASGANVFAVDASTGGTSGVPLELRRSLRSVVFEQASIDEMLRLLGVDPSRARIAVLRGDDIRPPSDFRPPYWKEVAGGSRLLLSSNHLDARTAPLYAAALESFAPDVLWVYPTSLESLCLQLERAGRQLRLPRVLTSSEVLSAEVWRLAQETLRCELLDYYGQGERVAFAFAQRAGEYRFLPVYSYVELLAVDEEAGMRVFEIVGTSYWNAAMQLVRYRTGDLMRLPESWGAGEIEEVTLGWRPFGGVLGRDSDILVSPEGASLAGIDHFHRGVRHVARIQVIQETPTEVRILLLAEPGYSRSDGDELMRNVRRKLPSSMRVALEVTDSLERAASGKTPFVIHRPAVEEHLRGARHRRGSS